MNQRLIFTIAKSLLLARWKQTLVAAIGVTFSITMFIALLGFMNGLNDLLDGLVVNRTAHVRLYNDIKPNKNQPIYAVTDYKNHYNFFQSGIKELDKVQSFASISTVQKLLGKPNSYITDIQVKLKDMTLAPAVAKEYAQLFQTDAEDIQTANAQFETGSFVRTVISYSIGIVLLIVAGFGIYLNILISLY
jgi:ABC-type lipoprotein release transport system permease subunit